MRQGTNPAQIINGGAEAARKAVPGGPKDSADTRQEAMAPELREISPAAFGIPEEEFTPSVRQALVALLQRNEALRRDAESAKARLDDAARFADLDGLLPILNRRAFVRELNRFIGFAERYGTPACLFYFDVDRLKAINDFYGHAAGDTVLAHFASVLKSQIRDTDILARIGGDEFGVILAHSTLERAEKKAERLMTAIKETPAVWNGQSVNLHVSYGIHKLRAGECPEDAIAKADAAMYEHKRLQG